MLGKWQSFRNTCTYHKIVLDYFSLHCRNWPTNFFLCVTSLSPWGAAKQDTVKSFSS